MDPHQTQPPGAATGAAMAKNSTTKKPDNDAITEAPHTGSAAGASALERRLAAAEAKADAAEEKAAGLEAEKAKEKAKADAAEEKKKAKADKRASKSITGIFPAFDSRRPPRPRMMHTKAGLAQMEELRLRNVRNGNVHSFLLDGHDPETKENMQAQEQAVRNIEHETVAVDPRGFPIRLFEGAPCANDENGVPVDDEGDAIEFPADAAVSYLSLPTFFLDRGSKPVKIGKTRVPVMTDEHEAAMQGFAAQREARHSITAANLADALERKGPTFEVMPDAD